VRKAIKISLPREFCPPRVAGARTSGPWYH